MVLFVTNNINFDNIMFKMSLFVISFYPFFHEVKNRWKLFSASNSTGNFCTDFYNKWNQRCVVQALVERRKGFVRHSTFHHGNTMTWTFFVESYYCGHTKVPTFFPSCFRLCRLNKKLYFKSKFQYLVKLSLVLYKKRVEKNEIAIIVK